MICTGFIMEIVFGDLVLFAVLEDCEPVLDAMICTGFIIEVIFGDLIASAVLFLLVEV